MTSKSLIYFIISASLLAIGAAIGYLARYGQSPQTLADEISRDLQAELQKVSVDIQEINAKDFEDFLREDWAYPVYLFQNGKLIRWSDNKFIPPSEVVTDTSGFKLISTENESYLLVRKQVSEGLIAVVAIDLLKKYPINNDYLTNRYNRKILPSGNVKLYDVSVSSGLPVCVGSSCYFRVAFQSDEIRISRETRTLMVISISFGILLLLVGLFKIKWRRTIYPEVTFVYLGVVLLGVRLLMTYFNFPGALIQTDLFDPQYFASSAFNGSFGDLLLNLTCVLILSIYVFENYVYFTINRTKRSPTWSWVFCFFCGLATLFAGLFPIVVVQTLYNNSTVDLDITEVTALTSLRITAFLCVILAGVCAFLFSHVFIRLLESIKDRRKILLASLVACSVFVLINEISGQSYKSTLLAVIAYAGIVLWRRLDKSLKRLSFNTFAYLFIAIFFLAVNGAYSIQFFSHRKKIETQFRFANTFLIDRDYFGEFLLHELSTKVQSDVFIQTRIVSPFLGKEAIRQKIRQVLLPSYFNKYDVQIFIFNALGDPLDNRTQTFSDFISAYEGDAYKTEYEGIRFVNNPASDITQKYLIISPIRRLSHNSGYVVIELSLKKVIPENVYPELLVDYRFQDFYKTRDLSYALLVGKELSFSSGDFNYESRFGMHWLGNTSLYTTGISANGFDHIAVEDETGRIAIVSSKIIPFIQKLGNFSLLLVLGLFTILILIFVFGVYQYFKGSRLFFSARIQLYLNLAFFIPLIIVSVSTLSLTSRSSQEQLNEEYINKSRLFAEQMTNYLKEDTLTQNIGTSLLTNRLTELSKLSNLDANVFSAQGRLIGTSQPLIFENALISEYINPRAFSKVIHGETLFIESENVEKLDYYVSYAVLKSSQTGNVLGILGIPFFQSANLLSKIQSVVLINILNIFAFIFIILLLLSYVVAERLTFPLRFITNSLRRTSLNNNTPLTWAAQDEIGMMVKEYNSMLFKLAESKSELEHTQREKAWREIAQQVAHEIKNPLTPMKLTLQQLERTVQSGNATAEKTQKAIETLLSQIDTLNDIASSFSGFAKMPEPVIQRVDLVLILKHAVDLHSTTGQIVFKSPFKDAPVMGDAQLLSRTFSNLILNGLQAVKPGSVGNIFISLERAGVDFRVSVTDNGRGISPENQERVFLPHFSTKKSGSGLGLAIAKQAIEQMKGKIWFHTEIDRGTTFHVQLPCAE